MADEEELDLDASMAETLREINSASEEEVEEPEAEEPEAEKPAGTARDEKGRFKAKAEEPGAELPDDSAPVDEPGAEIPQDSAPTIPPELVNPPPTWTAEAKSMWKDVPPRIRQEVLKREQDSLRGVEQIRERASFGDRLERVISPYRALIQSEGATPEQAIEGLMNTAYTLRQGQVGQKVQLAIEMAQQYGFLDQLVAHIRGNGQNTQAGGQINHVLAPIQQELASLKQKLAQKEQQEREVEERQYQEQAHQFVTEVDAAGNLKHPYFENVKDVMIGLLNAGSAKTYEDAYQMAVWSNPETRQIVEAEQETQRQAKSQAEAKARAEKARKAQTVNLRSSGTHGANAPKTPVGSIDDTMRETLARLRESA